MKTLYLHIGRHKSGTSSIQHFLSLNKNKLSEINYLYPDEMKRNVAHHPLALMMTRKAIKQNSFKSLLENKEYLYFRDNIFDILTDKNVIISSEAFQNCDPFIVREAFADIDVVICVYIREQASYLLSSYAQYIHATSGDMTLEEFNRARFNPNYLKFLTGWENAFGFNSINVRIFDKKCLVNSNVIDDFLIRMIGIKSEIVDNLASLNIDSNPSLTSTLVELKRYANSHQLLNRFEKSKVYNALSKMSLQEKYHGKLFLKQKIFDDLEKRFGMTNTMVNEKYFSDSNCHLELNKSLIEKTQTRENTVEINEFLQDIKTNMA